MADLARLFERAAASRRAGGAAYDRLADVVVASVARRDAWAAVFPLLPPLLADRAQDERMGRVAVAVIAAAVDAGHDAVPGSVLSSCLASCREAARPGAQRHPVLASVVWRLLAKERCPAGDDDAVLEADALTLLAGESWPVGEAAGRFITTRWLALDETALGARVRQHLVPVVATGSDTHRTAVMGVIMSLVHVPAVAAAVLPAVGALLTPRTDPQVVVRAVDVLHAASSRPVPGLWQDHLVPLVLQLLAATPPRIGLVALDALCYAPPLGVLWAAALGLPDSAELFACIAGHARDALGEDSSDVPPLLDRAVAAVRRESARTARAAVRALRALAEFQPARTMEALGGVLTASPSCPDPAVLALLIELYGEHLAAAPGPDTLDRILDRHMLAADWAVRESCVGMLGAVAPLTAGRVEQLVERAGDGESFVRARALAGLAGMRGNEGADAVERATAALVGGVGDDEAFVRRAAVEALTQWQRTPLLAAMVSEARSDVRAALDRAERDKDWEVKLRVVRLWLAIRETAADAYARLDGDKHLEAMRTQDPDRVVRAYVTRTEAERDGVSAERAAALEQELRQLEPDEFYGSELMEHFIDEPDERHQVSMDCY